MLGTVKPATVSPRSCRQESAPANASRRTAECIPSAPTTRSKRRAGPRANVTSTPSGVCARAVMWSPKMYCATSLLWSCRIRARSPRSISTSPLNSADGNVDKRRPVASITAWSPMPVWHAWISPSTPIRASRASWSPRKSTADAPLVRSPGARSTTVTVYPDVPSQYASDGPAMPPPEMSTDLVIGSSLHRRERFLCAVASARCRHRTRFYPYGQSNWIIQLVDRAAMIGAMGDRRGEPRHG